MNELDQKLRKYLNFDETDLEKNRAGQMSPRQIQATQQLIQAAKPIIYLATGVMALIIIVFVTILVALSIEGIAAILMIILFGLLMGAGAGAIFYFVLNPRIKKWEENFQLGGIVSMQGTVELEKRNDLNGPGKDYFLHLNGTRFRVTQAHFMAFENGERYTIYYAENNRYILTAEATE